MADNLSQKQPKPSENTKVGNASNVGGNDTLRIGEVERVVSHPTCLTSGAAINQRKKAPSFQITSVSVGSNSRTSNDGGDDSADDLDESHTDDFSIDNSRITDFENETPSFSEDTFSKDELYFNPSNPSLTSVPVIPTSSQYGLAIVGTDTENSGNNANLINAAVVCANNISAGDASVTVTEAGNVINLMPNTKSDIEMRDHPTHHASRNERFKVVKIESTEPFKRGRWMCMDYLDHTILQQQQSQLSGIGVKDSDTLVGTAHFIAPESSIVILADNLPLRGHDEQADPAYKSVVQDNHLVNQQGTVNVITGQALPSFPNISPGQSLQQDLQQVSVTNTQGSLNPQLQQVNPPSQQVNSSQQNSALSQPVLPPGSQPVSLQSQQISSQVQQNQQLNQQNQQINPNSQVNQHIQQQFNSQTMNPQSQFNTQPQQTNQAQQNQGLIGQGQQQISQQSSQVNQQITQQSQHFNSPSSHMSSQPQQYNSQTQQFSQQPSHQIHQGSNQQNMAQIQQNLQGQNFQNNSQQVSQAQSMTQVPIQCTTSMPAGQALQHQSLPPQQLQQVLNAVNMQQMGVQQGLVQPQHMIHQGMNQFQHQSTQYYGQGGIQILPPQSGMPTSNSMASVTLQHPPPVQSSASMPLPIPNAGAMTSQIARQQQIPVPSQQQAQIQQQMQIQQMASRQTQSLQQIPMQQQQTVPMQAQYSVQQQFPMQHQQQFPVQQQFSVQQQIPLVQLYSVQQQQQVPMQSSQVPLQQQILQQNYQPMPNMQQSGQQIMTRNLPTSDSQQHNVNQSGLIQGSQIPSGLHQNYVHQVPTSTQSEQPFFTAANSRPETQMTAPRNAGAGDASNAPGLAIVQAGALSTNTPRTDIGEQSSVEAIPSLNEIDAQSAAEDHPAPSEDPESLNGLAQALASSGRCPPLASSSSSSPSTLSPPLGQASPVPERHSASGTSAVAIDNKIEQAMDLVKSHLMFAVREEVEVLKEKIAELMERISQLEVENTLLRAHAPPEVVASLPQPPSGNPPPSQPPPNGSVS